MIFSEFNSIVAQALTPITLISGVGILMLCMTARYNHATERIRQLMEKREASGTTVEPDIDAEIDLIAFGHHLGRALGLLLGPDGARRRAERHS